MQIKDYIWFWKTSWSYMKGSRREFWFGLIKATYNYRKAFIEDKKNGYKYGN